MSNPFRAYAHQEAPQRPRVTVPQADSGSDPSAEPDLGRRMEAWEARWTSVTAAVMAESDILDRVAIGTRLAAVENTLAAGRIPEREVRAFFAELGSILGLDAFAGLWALPTGEALRIPDDVASLNAFVRLCHDLLCAIHTGNDSLARNAVERVFMLGEIVVGSSGAESAAHRPVFNPHEFFRNPLPEGG